jgi:hypothetical protein
MPTKTFDQMLAELQDMLEEHARLTPMEQAKASMTASQAQMPSLPERPQNRLLLARTQMPPVDPMLAINERFGPMTDTTRAGRPNPALSQGPLPPQATIPETIALSAADPLGIPSWALSKIAPQAGETWRQGEADNAKAAVVGSFATPAAVYNAPIKARGAWGQSPLAVWV